MCLSIKIDFPDHVLAEGEHAGFKWTVVHNGMGYRCGYIRLPVGHPWHGQDYDDIPAECHGGLTFAQPDVPCDAPGEDNAWWIGFDCAHAFDLPDMSLPFDSETDKASAERMASLFKNYPDSAVRTQEYVEAQCARLCEQAAAVQAPSTGACPRTPSTL